MVKVILSLTLALSIAAVSVCQSNKADTPNKPANVAPANAAATAANSAGEQKVTINSPDGVKLVGTFYPAGNPHAKAVLLLHQWQSDRHSYDDFAKQLQGKGFAVLSIDGRGFGESTRAADGTTVPAERTDAAVKAMLGDVGAAFDFLAKQQNVDAWRVGIVGASYGSSLALIYAADHPNVGAVALLSPGLNYFGNMPTEPAVKKYGGRPLLFLAAEDDKESADTVRKLDPMGQDQFRYPQKIYTTGGHGTALLTVGAGAELESFFSRVFDLAGKQPVKP
jgi:dienelactone hydrolase